MKKKVEPNSESQENRRPVSTPSTDFAGDEGEASEMNGIQTVMEKLLHWAAIIESSDDAIISNSMEGIITSWNRGAEVLYGYTSEEIIGKHISILMPPEHEDDFPNIVGQLREGKKVEHFETRRVTKYGKVLDVSISVSPIRDPQGKIIGASKIARDISERKENERRRDEFVSTASHELRTPITSQKIFGELLQQMLIKNGHEEHLPYIRKINAQTEKLIKLVSDLLELSRMASGRLELDYQLFDPKTLAEEIIGDIQQITDHKLTLRVFSGELVSADRDRVGHVLVNLLSNAIKYSYGKKEIIITIESREQFLVISVQDFGIGISKEYQKKIFERFFKVSEAGEATYPGMGIGLNFCQEIIRRHGGEVWVESKLGKGATFFFSLPLAPKKQQEAK